ncbi:MAG: hypothetical protein PVJ57_04710 [Phycisphaerae bacterium]|jgi:hypothetical protein
MSKKKPPAPAETNPAPFGAGVPRSRVPLYVWIVLCVGWFVFLLVLAVREFYWV